MQQKLQKKLSQKTSPKDDPIRHLIQCPKCGAGWDAGDIFETLRKQDWWQNTMSEEQLKQYVKNCYSPPYRFSRLIGIEDPTIYDGVSWWMCPDCKVTWKRFTDQPAKLEKPQ